MPSSRGCFTPRDGMSPALQVDSVPTEPPGQPHIHTTIYKRDNQQGLNVEQKEV